MADTFNKRFSGGDVFNIPYNANKQWDIPSGSFDDLNIFGQLGIKPSDDLPTKDYTYENKVYKSVLANFYSESYPTQSLSAFPLTYYYTTVTSKIEVPVNTVPTSYYSGLYYTLGYYKIQYVDVADYKKIGKNSYAVSGSLRIGNPLTTIKNYPTSESSQIYILNVPHKVYSNKLLPTTVELDLDGGYKVYDDGEYNIYWSGSSTPDLSGNNINHGDQVGNVFYEHGLIVFTRLPGKAKIPISISTSTTNKSCFGIDDGTITVNVSDGTGPFIYELVSQVITTPLTSRTHIFSSLAAGTYTVKVTDTSDGTIQTSAPITITSPPQTFYTVTLVETSNNLVKNDTWDKEHIKTYEVQVTPPLDPADTLNVVLLTAEDFQTNYNDAGSIGGRASSYGTSPMQVYKNGVLQVNQTSISTNTYAPMTCAADRIYFQQRIYKNTFTLTSTDTHSIISKVTLQTEYPQGGACPSNAYHELRTYFQNQTVSGPCSPGLFPSVGLQTIRVENP